MGFLHNRALFFFAIVTLLGAYIIFGCEPDSPDTSGKPENSTPAMFDDTAEKSEAPAGESGEPAPVTGYIDSGALQDDMGTLRPMSEEELALLARQSAGASSPAVVYGREFYKGVSPTLAWAQKQELRGPYRDYMPEAADLEIEEDQGHAIYLLQEAEDVSRASEASSTVPADYYSHSLRHFLILELFLPGRTDMRSAAVRAWNGLARTLPPEERGPAYDYAAQLAKDLPDNSLNLTQWGIALMGQGAAASGPEQQTLYSQAREKLQKALDMNTNQAATAYALAVLAARQQDNTAVEAMLRKAAGGSSPVSGLYLVTDPAFTHLHGEAWFPGVAGLFPPSRESRYSSPEEAANWLAEELQAAKPSQGTGRSTLMANWGRNLASAFGWDNDPARRSLILNEIDRLFSRGRDIADPAYTAEEYLDWGDSLAVAPMGCETDVLPWSEKSLAAYKNALDLDPSLLSSASSALWVYGTLVECAQGEERERLYEERNNIAKNFVPADMEARQRIAEYQAYDLLQWAEHSPARLRESRFKEALKTMDAALAQARAQDDAYQLRTALQKSAGFKLYMFRLVDERSGARLLEEAEAEAAEFASSASPKEMRYFSGVYISLAHSFEGNPEKRRLYAQKTLDVLISSDPGVLDYRDYDLAGDVADALENMGMAEQAPALQRELYYIAASMALRVLEARPCDQWRWNFWGVCLNRLAMVVPQEDRAAAFDLCKGIFLRLDAMDPGSESYNVACLEALTGNPDAARHWLERARDFKTLPSRQHMLTDPDMNPIRNQPWFNSILPEE